LAYSKIVITQGGTPGGAGVSRDDLDLYAVASQDVVLTNETAGDVGVATWLWTLEERPPGSAISMLNPTSSTAQLRPDVYGRYVVSLRVNDLGNSTEGYSKLVVGCRYPTLGTAPGGWEIGEFAPPAFSEGTLANWGGNPYGAQPEIYELFRQVRELLLPAAIGTGTAKTRLVFTQPPSLVSRSDQPSPGWATSAVTWGINMADYPWVNTAKFFAVAIREGTAGTAKVQLYDRTNAVAVTSSDVTTTALSTPLVLR
jgi:hypothetical protein